MPQPTRIRPIARRALAAQSDERLVRLFREGHEAAFEEIVGRYQQPLTAFAAAIVPYHRAEDVVQTSLLKAHKALLADDREVSLRAWLFTIVRNGALNVIRDDPDWQELDPSYDGVPQPAAVAEQNEELHALVTAICALPASQRRALIGREIEGEGHAEIAAELGTTTTAVRGLIFRARTAVRNALGAAIPLPLLRLLLIEAPAVGAAGVGAGATAVGGGTKLAAAMSATAIAIGGGVAIERERDDAGGGPEKAEAAGAAEAATDAVGSSSADPGARRVSISAAASNGGGQRSTIAAGNPARRDSGNPSGGDGRSGTGTSDDRGSARHGSDPDPRPEDGRDGPRSGPEPHPGGDDRGGDHHGPGPDGPRLDDGDRSGPEQHEPDEDRSGPGGGDSSGPGDGEREPDEDRSGPGGDRHHDSGEGEDSDDEHLDGHSVADLLP